MSLNNKYIKLVVFICLFSFGSVFFVQTQTASALPLSDALKACDIRIKRAACLTAVRACPTNACRTQVLNNVTLVGTRVMEACRTVPDPQKCHTKVVEECGGNPSALAACRARTIQELFPGAPAGGAGGGSTTEGFGTGAALAPKGAKKGFKCGEGPDAIETRFKLGCKEKGNAISDMLFALVKFLTVGIGIILVLSIIIAGIQYTTSGGSAEETQKAKDRIMHAMVALVFYLIISAFAQYLVPGGIF